MSKSLLTAGILAAVLAVSPGRRPWLYGPVVECVSHADAWAAGLTDASGRYVLLWG